jgi:hypothetical protein
MHRGPAQGRQRARRVFFRMADNKKAARREGAPQSFQAIMLRSRFIGSGRFRCSASAG